MPPLDRQVRVCILYEFKLGNVANLAFLNVNRAFGEGTVSNTIVHRWFARFQEGDEDLDVEPTKELDIDEGAIEEDPELVEALLARQFGVAPGTLHFHLDRMGRGEKLKEAQQEAANALTDFKAHNSAKSPGPSTSMHDPTENGSTRVMPGVSGENNVKLEVPEDIPDNVTLKDMFRSRLHDAKKLQSSGGARTVVRMLERLAEPINEDWTAASRACLKTAGSPRNGRTECNKVRISDSGPEYRSTLSGSSQNKINVVIDPPVSHVVPEGRKISPRGGGVIARSLACLAKYRAANQEQPKRTVNPVKPSSADEASNSKNEMKMEKKETVQFANDGAEMKEHIVPLF